MDIEKIKNAKTNKIGKQVEYYKEIDSTSKYAKKIAENDDENGKIIIADKQTAGIGTKGRSWYTGSEKNIAMTLILKPKCNVNELEGLTIKIAEIIKESILELYDIDLTIKIPNDLLYNNKKVCGILTEIATQAEKIKYLLIGIGINVNEEEFSEEIINLATSLKKEKEKDNNYSREDIIIKIIEKLEKEIEI